MCGNVKKFCNKNQYTFKFKSGKKNFKVCHGHTLVKSKYQKRYYDYKDLFDKVPLNLFRFFYICYVIYYRAYVFIKGKSGYLDYDDSIAKHKFLSNYAKDLKGLNLIAGHTHYGGAFKNYYNSGFIEPQTAADLAIEFGIKTYTIGIGTNGNAPSPIAYNPDGSFRYGMRQVEIDEALLKDIAKVTGGKYFRATNNKKLEAIYDEINKLEKTEIEEFKYYKYEEKFRPWIFIAGILLLLEWLLRNTLFRSFV